MPLRDDACTTVFRIREGRSCRGQGSIGGVCMPSVRPSIFFVVFGKTQPREKDCRHLSVQFCHFSVRFHMVGWGAKGGTPGPNQNQNQNQNQNRLTYYTTFIYIMCFCSGFGGLPEVEMVILCTVPCDCLRLGPVCLHAWSWTLSSLDDSVTSSEDIKHALRLED